MISIKNLLNELAAETEVIKKKRKERGEK